MRLIYSPAFLKDYAKLSVELRAQTDKQLTILSKDPRRPSLRSHKRRGEKNIWQARITRSYRIIFEMEGDTIALHSVGPHE